MKTLIPFSLMLVSGAAAAQRQYIGIAGGLTTTNVTGTSSGREPESKNGFYAGLSYEHRTKGHWHFGADLLYQQRGYRTTLVLSIPQYPEGVRLQSRYDFNYLVLPLKAGVHFGKKLSGYANLGIVPALRIDTRLSWKDQPYPGGIYPAETHDVNDTQGFDVAGLAELGAGYELRSRVQLCISAGFQHSIGHYNLPNFIGENNWHYGFTGGLGLRYALNK